MVGKPPQVYSQDILRNLTNDYCIFSNPSQAHSIEISSFWKSRNKTRGKMEDSSRKILEQEVRSFGMHHARISRTSKEFGFKRIS